jgi:leucyl/phenylalanyl-tRNA--protein transferase
VAFANLVERLKKDGFELIDCQIPSPHLESLGARKISRNEFIQHLNNLIYEDFSLGHWN